MIIVNDLAIQYRMDNKPIDILSINQLVIQHGEQVAITGPSGSGKSTLLHCIGGVIQPNAGEILIKGTDIASLSQEKRDDFRQKHIGYIFQDFYLIPSLTAEENIKLILPKMPKQKQDALLEEWFAKVSLEDRRKHLPSQLSRGQQQRVAIIRALIHKPAIVLADEPTGSLDYETAQQVMSILLNLCKEQNQTLLFVTHDLAHPKLFTKHLQMEQINQVMNKGVSSHGFITVKL